MSNPQQHSSPQVPHQAPPQQLMQQDQAPAQQQMQQQMQSQAPPQQVQQPQQPQQHYQTPNPTPPQQNPPYQPPQVQQTPQPQAQQIPQQHQQQGLGQHSQQTPQLQITHQHPQPGTPQVQPPTPQHGQQQQHQPQPQQQQPPQARPQVQTQYTGPPQQPYQPQQLAGQARPYQAPPQAAGAPAYYAANQPPLKRQRVSPDPRSAPTSPYTQSPYGPSPTTTQAPPFPNAIPQQPYQGPYSNPNPAPLSHPSPYSAPPPPQPPNYQAVQPSNLHQQPPHLQPQPGYASPSSQYQNNYIPPQQQPPQQMPPQQHTGTMGPPPGPPFRPPAKEESANDDQMDVLANAGVDLRAEESFAMSFHTSSYNSQPKFSQVGPNATGSAYTQFTPGGADSFYGAGPANQPGVPVNGKTQKEIEEATAKAAWEAATVRLAQSRQHELQHPHTHVGALWNRMAKIAQENGLVLSTDKGQMPQLKLPTEFPDQRILRTKVGPEGNLVVADGMFLPQDTALADQLALMSLATNTRIRTLLEETVALARSRRIGSHGIIPEEYKDIAIAQSPAAGTIVPENGLRHIFESAVSPRTSPLNGTDKALQPTSGNVQPNGQIQMTNETVKALRESAARERACEEARLQRRAERLANPSAIPAAGGAPGTPGVKGQGDIAPEPSTKPMTKKEREKADKGKQSLVDSHAQANATTATFLFGGKKKNKYSWMDSTGGSGASMPGRVGTGMGVAGLGGEKEKVRLTGEGKNRMGGWREDREGGKGVQLRDLVLCLEQDGREKKALQRIYPWLDTPKPKPGPAL